MINTLQRPREFTLNTASPLARGLVFAGLGRFVGSNQFFDSSLRRGHGTLTNMALPTSWDRYLGRPILTFDGTDDYVNIPTSTAFDLTTDGTLAMWVNLLTNTGTSWFGRNDFWGPGNDAFGLSRLGTSQVMGIIAANSGGYVLASVSFSTLNEWHNWAVAWNNANSALGTVDLYLDGLKVASAATVAGNLPAANSGALTIGAINTPAHYANISSADALMWNYRLSDAHIRALANPANTHLEIAGIPLVQPVRRRGAYKAPAAASTFRRTLTNRVGARAV